MAKRGRPKQQTAKHAVIRSEEATESAAVWITQSQNGVLFGVRDYGRPGKRTTERAIREFLRAKHFVEVELPELEANNLEEKLKLSEERARKASGA